jgi:type I restriction enzyme S subunit
MKTRTYKLADLATPEKHSFVGGPFGSKLTSRDYTEEGVPVIRGANLGGSSRYLGGEFVFVSSSKADTLSSNMAHPEDLVFTQRGTLGQVALVPRNPTLGDRLVVSQSQMKMTVDETKATPCFLYYYFTRFETIEDLKARAITSGVPHINLTIMRNFEVDIPEVALQRRIADTLSAYDDLIENNNRRMALLEESIHLLYREWFVYLRFPGYERVEIVDGVPEGWARRELGEILTLKYGKGLTKKARKPGPVPVYGSSGVVGYHNKALVGGNAIVVGRKGNVGSVFWSSIPFHPIDTVYYVSPAESSLYVYALLSNETFVSSDAAVPGLNRNYAHGKGLLLPPKSLEHEFNELAHTSWTLRENMAAQNRRLREARDLMLPRLMDGRIPV